MLLPAELTDDEIARRISAVGALDHLAHDLTGHDLADRRRFRVRACLAHPPAHVRIEREPLRADEHLALPRLGNGRLEEREVGFLRKADGTGGEGDLAIGHGFSFPRDRRAAAPGGATGAEWTIDVVVCP